mmetsp:Transcript_26087/g.63107  ORF Transcript_26087/g.63107 Transcript_26087/m.63107 type:complete len:323 (-) Transcript_26087:2-970(-)
MLLRRAALAQPLGLVVEGLGRRHVPHGLRQLVEDCVEHRAREGGVELVRGDAGYGGAQLVRHVLHVEPTPLEQLPVGLGQHGVDACEELRRMREVIHVGAAGEVDGDDGHAELDRRHELDEDARAREHVLRLDEDEAARLGDVLLEVGLVAQVVRVDEDAVAQPALQLDLQEARLRRRLALRVGDERAVRLLRGGGRAALSLRLWRSGGLSARGGHAHAERGGAHRQLEWETERLWRRAVEKIERGERGGAHSDGRGGVEGFVCRREERGEAAGGEARLQRAVECGGRRSLLGRLVGAGGVVVARLNGARRDPLSHGEERPR